MSRRLPALFSAFVAAALLGAVMAVAPTHAQTPEPFFGTYEGTGTSRDPNVSFFELTQRDLDVTIGPDGAGFFVEWTTVIRDFRDTEPRRRFGRAFFDPSDRPGIYVQRGAAEAISDGVSWASINRNTLTVRVLRIEDDGSYAVQTYHRTVDGNDMFLHFVSDRDGHTIRTVTARLRKKE